MNPDEGPEYCRTCADAMRPENVPPPGSEVKGTCPECGRYFEMTTTIAAPGRYLGPRRAARRVSRPVFEAQCARCGDVHECALPGASYSYNVAGENGEFALGADDA